MLKNLIKLYNIYVHSHPTLVMSTTSGITMGLGNFVCQLIAEKKSLTTVDYKRVIKYSLFGFLVTGPLLRHWLYTLDLKIFNKNRESKLRPLKMMLLDQSVMPTVLNSLFLFYINYLATYSINESVSNAKKALPPILVESYKIWPIVTLVNFYLVPLQHRVLFGNIVALLWNIYFSYLVAK